MTPKFRAWHKLHGEMREVYGITFNNKQKITSLLIKGFQPGERSDFFGTKRWMKQTNMI